jgi:deazaflavin-dependent oxidoreductase (nitroreductase family)
MSGVEEKVEGVEEKVEGEEERVEGQKVEGEKKKAVEQKVALIERVERKRNPFTKSSGGGRMLSALMFPLSVRPPRSFGVLTTKGRKSGKWRRKCVHPVRDGEKVYILMLRPSGAAVAENHTAGWLLNIRADPRVRLRMHGGSFAGRARELHNPAEIERASAVYCGAVHPFDYMECSFHRGGLPTRAKIEELHRSWLATGVPLVVELQ